MQDDDSDELSAVCTDLGPEFGGGGGVPKLRVPLNTKGVWGFRGGSMTPYNTFPTSMEVRAHTFFLGPGKVILHNIIQNCWSPGTDVFEAECASAQYCTPYWFLRHSGNGHSLCLEKSVIHCVCQSVLEYSYGSLLWSTAVLVPEFAGQASRGSIIAQHWRCNAPWISMLP